MITAAQWLQVLAHCGVRFTTAVSWAKVFEARVQPQNFNLGARELDDFVGQILHETALLEHLEENLNYSARRIAEIGNQSPPGSRWRSLVPRASELNMQPEKFANAVYGGRLGNARPGDGWLYRGRGIPMVTGRDNYALLAKLTGLPLLEQPQLLSNPDGAMRCGVLWWEKKIPDAAIDSVERVTRAVQGAQLGLADRKLLTDKAAAALIACGAGV